MGKEIREAKKDKRQGALFVDVGAILWLISLTRELNPQPWDP
jgi:hypothetical protein